MSTCSIGLKFLDDLTAPSPCCDKPAGDAIHHASCETCGRMMSIADPSPPVACSACFWWGPTRRTIPGAELWRRDANPGGAP